jgi:uncharacterized membrane protein
MMQQALLATIIIGITVASILWLNNQAINWVQQILNWFPAILFAYVIPALITHTTGSDFSSVYLHSLSRNWIVPFAVMTVMSALSFPQLKKVGARPIVLFLSGSFAIAVLPPLLVWSSQFFSESSYVLFVEQELWRGLVPVAGSWIGGSTSQLVLKELVNCPETLFLSVIVLDNILVNCWTIIMFQVIQRSDRINRFFRISGVMPEVQFERSVSGSRSRASILITVLSIIVAVGLINFITTDFLVRVMALSIFGLVAGNFIPTWNHQFVLKAGSILIIVIMAILGLRLDFTGLSLPVSFVILCLVWLMGHYLFMMLIARILNVHMAWVPIASMANLGGISTAPAVTSAYNKKWMPHAILLAILSMVTGNVWGMLSMYLFTLFY